MGIDGLSLSVRQIVRLLVGSRESNLIVFGIVLLSFWVPCVPMIWGHAPELYYTGTGQVLRAIMN